MAADRSAYEILQVEPTADTATLLAAFRRLARRFHPDHVETGSTERMVELNMAWERLRNPERRAAYDHEIGIGPRPPERADDRPPTPATPGTAWSTIYMPGGHPLPGAMPGTGAAGPPPGNPSGSVLTFGRHIGWSIGEVLRVDRGYLEWLVERREGARYRTEIQAILERGRARSAPPPAPKRSRFFGR